MKKPTVTGRLFCHARKRPKRVAVAGRAVTLTITPAMPAARPKRIYLAFHWYLETLHEGALSYCLEQGWCAYPLNSDTLDELRETPPDGVVGMISGDPAHPVSKYILGLPCPVVELSLAYPEKTGWGRCPECCENAARTASAHLLTKGCASHAFVCRQPWWNNDRRWAVFDRAFAAPGRPCVRIFLNKLGSSPAEQSRNLGRELSGLPRPIGVFGSVDEMARISVDSSRAAGLKVPGDVFAVGFGNRELVSKFAPIPVSTVSIDYRAWARRSCVLLHDLMLGRCAPGTVVEFESGALIERESSASSTAAHALCARAVARLRDNLAEPPSVPGLAGRLAVSKATLERAFRTVYGCGVARKSLSLRIDRARELMAAGDKVVAVSHAVGFRSARAFTEAFRRITGDTPGAYAKSFERPPGPR